MSSLFSFEADLAFLSLFSIERARGCLTSLLIMLGSVFLNYCTSSVISFIINTIELIKLCTFNVLLGLAEFELMGDALLSRKVSAETLALASLMRSFMAPNKST